MVKKRKPKSRRKPKLPQNIIAEARRVPLLLQDLYRTEMRASAAEKELAEIKSEILAFLTPDQIEHAHVAGVTPTMYFLEYVSLCKEKLFAQAANTLAVKSFPELRRFNPNQEPIT